MFEASKLISLGKEISVLYVEDDHMVANETKSFLKKFFTIVDVMHDAKKALQLFKEHRHDLVITDIKMQQMDGLELAKHIREINPEQKILAISAYNFKDFATEERHKRFDGFLQKPVAYSELITALEEMCEEILEIKSKGDENTLLSEDIASLEIRIEALEKRIEEIEGKQLNNGDS